MGKGPRNKLQNATTVAKSRTEQMRSHGKKKTNSRPKDLDFQEIPFKLREIMKSKMEMNKPKKKRKRKPESQRGQNSELQTDIPVPKFKRGRKESVGAYLDRMNREAKHVIFLSKNQPDREPELEMEEPKASDQKEKSQNKKSQNKKDFDRRRLDKILRKKEMIKETRLEKDIFQDTVKFGEVAMEPPSLTAKPRKSGTQTKPGEKQLLLKKLFNKESGPSKPPAMSLARKRLIEEERERVIQAYRELKKQKLQQGATEHNLL
ncbi:coiled-coil domain-containing protein 137 [Rhinophrynus dorsalis]